MEIVSPKYIHPSFAPVVSACKFPCHRAHQSAEHPLLGIQQQMHPFDDLGSFPVNPP
jgi:hypothetical protein